MQSFLSMRDVRDRRNASLSISSTSSINSNSSMSSQGSYVSEKRHSSPPPPSTMLEPESPVSTETTKENVRSRRRIRLSSKGWRLAGILFALFVLWKVMVGRTLSASSLTGTKTEVDEVVEEFDEAKAVVVKDHAGNSKWTVSIPHNASFPLESRQYKDICTQSEGLSAELHRSSQLETQIDRLDRFRPRGKYYAVDRTFIDPASSQSDPRVCEKTLTLSLDTTDPSFGRSLLLLWMSYGLAKKEGREFFIDDTRWPYGNYSQYFVPPPKPSCLPPPANHIVPCPHHARHIVVSAATTPWTFGSSFHEAFTIARKHDVSKQKPIHDLLHKGYEDLFYLIGDDATYAAARIDELRKKAKETGSKTIGIHIRRGDLHPYEYQFAADYLPLSRYGTAARKLTHALLTPKKAHTHSAAASDDLDTLLTHSLSTPLLLASDDPNLLQNPDLTSSTAPQKLTQAQSRIQLATKAALDASSPASPIRQPGSAYVKHIDENAGWEGGFHAPLFANLGSPRRGELTQEELRERSRARPLERGGGKQGMRLRELVGRAYLLDLAVLGQAGDGVVCGVSAAACRVLGVVLGWEGVEGGRWVNVDDGRGWTWDGRR